MTEKQKNYNDIIKAVECCRTTHCSRCVRLMNGHREASVCRIELLNDVIDIMNRQKAEIERLQRLGASATRRMLNARTEAIKEFAERLKENVDVVYSIKHLQDNIDNLVKEMVGERE